MSIGRKAIVSTLWTSGLNYIAMVVGFVFGIFRDRMLLPDQNGIYMYGVAVVDILFILAAVSFNISVIQASDDKEDLYSTAFLLTIALSILMLFVTACTGYVLSLRHTLPLKIQAFLVLSLFSSLNLYSILFSSYLEKQLEYKKIARINLLSVLAFPIASYYLVSYGWGAWGMVLGYGSSFVVSFIGLFIVSKYPLGLKFNAATARWFMSMGWKLIFSRGMEVMFVRYGTLVTEAVLGTTLQGSYGRALKYWELAPQTVAPAVVTVALPTYSKLQNDPAKLSQAFSMVLFFLARVLMPFVLVFAILPESFIRMIGPQWLSAVPVLRILSLGALLAPVSENMKQLLYATGKPEKIVRIRIVQLVLFLPLMYFFIVMFGISGAAAGIVLNYFIGVIGSYVVIRSMVTVDWLRGFLPPFLFAAVSAALVLLFPIGAISANVFLQFGCEALYIVGVFFLLELVFEWSSIRNHFSFIRNILSSRYENSSRL